MVIGVLGVMSLQVKLRVAIQFKPRSELGLCPLMGSGVVRAWWRWGRVVDGAIRPIF